MTTKFYELLFENGYVGTIETDHYIDQGDFATAHINNTETETMSGTVIKVLDFYEYKD